jgi:hypothetical protein
LENNAQQPPVSSNTISQAATPRSGQAFYWPYDGGMPLDIDIASLPWRLQSGDLLMHHRAQLEDVRYQDNLEVHNPTIQTNLSVASLQRFSPSFDSVTTHETNILGSLHNFPPGSVTFPSSSSAHLAACEYFIKQNKVYKRRHQPGGTEASVFPELPSPIAISTNSFQLVKINFKYGEYVYKHSMA